MERQTSRGPRAAGPRWPFVLLPLLLIGTARAQTPVAGAINGEATWTVADSPYVLVDDVAVQAGSRLTIEPGVVVLGSAGADGDVELIVRGTLVAAGGADAPIVFRAQEGDAPGSWEGLRFEPGASATLRQVEIHHADVALELQAPVADNLVFDGVTVRRFRTRAVYATGGGSLTMRGLDIDGAGVERADGVYVSEVGLTLAQSRILRVDDGVFAADADVTLDHVIVAFTVDGAEFRVTSNRGRTLRIDFCTFYRNGDAVETYQSDSSYRATLHLDNSIFGLNTAVVRDGATASYRRSTFASFGRNVWWGERLESGRYPPVVPANASTSLRYNALLVDPDNGNFAPTDRSPARYFAPDQPEQARGAVPFAGAPTGEGVHGFWYVNHTFAPRTVTEVAGDIVVTRGNTLTFQPGAELRFRGEDRMAGGVDRERIELRVEGTLEADGTNSNPVRFTSAQAEPQPGDWYGILILSDTEAFNVSQVDLGYAFRGVSLIENDHIVAGSSIHHCADAGIWVQGGTPSVEQVDLYANRYGIYLHEGASVDIVGATIRQNTLVGLRSVNASFAIQDCIVRDNARQGMQLSVTNGDHQARVTHCTVAHNGDEGVWFQRTDSSHRLRLTLDSSSITHNTGPGLRDAATRQQWSTAVVCARSNVWGNGGRNLSGVSLADTTCFSYNPLYADADARNYEPTGFSPNRALGTDGRHVGALPHAGAVGPRIMGYLWEDFAFTAEGSPYSILGDVVVPEGVTVTFEPGAELRVAANADGMAGGLAPGQAEIRFLPGSTALFQGDGAPIRIRPASDTPRPGMWYGLRFEAGGGSRVDNAIIEYGTFGIHAVGPTAPVIEDTRLRHHQSYGIRFDGVVRAPLADVLGAWVIGDGDGVGIAFQDSAGRVRSSYVTHHDIGIRAQVTDRPGKTVYLVNNTLVHHDTGVWYQQTDSSRLSIYVLNNVIAYNRLRAIEDAATRQYYDSTDIIRFNNLFSTDARRGRLSQYEGNITTDPLVEDDDWDDFPRWWDGKLWAQSLAISAGDPNAAELPDRDILGKARNLAGGVDMGAFEFDPEANQEPRADAVATSIMVPRGEAFTLDGSAAVDPDGSIASAFWTMSDGTVTAGQVIEHTFEQEGDDRWAYITVIDDDGAEDHARVDVNVNVRPIADAGPAVFQDEGPDEAVFFDGTLSQDPDGRIVAWAWDFGDGSPISNEASPRHSYLSAGLYTVRLTVTDNEGLTDTDTTVATVFGNVDVVGPLIEHDEIPDGQPLGRDVLVQATIRDPSNVEGAALFYRARGEAAPRFVEMRNAGGDVWAATIPGEAVTAAGVEYWFTAIDGVDPDGNTSTAPPGAPAEGVFDFLVVGDPDPPTIAHQEIADGQDPGEAVTVTATITDATGVSEAVLFFRPEGGEAFGAVQMANPQGDLWTAQIPAFVVAPPGVQYFIQATDTSPIPNTGTAPAGAPEQLFDFVVGDPDRTAPAITHTPVADGQVAGRPVAIAASIVDDSRITSATVLYRRQGAAEFQAAPLVRGDGNAWSGAIPAAAVVEGTLQYYIRAEDEAGNVGTHPGGAPQTVHAFRVVAADAEGPAIAHEAIADGQPEGEAVTIAATAEDPSGVAFVRVHYRPAGFPFYQEVPLALEDGVYRGQIPGFAVAAPAVEYYLRAVDEAGNTSYAPAGAPGEPYRFTVRSGADEDGPVIRHAPVADDQPAGVAVVVEASVADVSGVAAVELRYRQAGAAGFDRAPMADQGGNIWRATIPAEAVRDPAVEYYLVATDASDAANTSTEPAGAPGVVHRFRVLPAVPGPRPGELVITELMPDPSVVADGDGEWFEVYVAADHEIELAGTVLADDGANRVTVEGSLRARPGRYLVFGRSADRAVNGGVAVDYAYGDALSLANGADALVIVNADGEVVDRVDYDRTADWPAVVGASMQLDGTAGPTDIDNAVAANWCPATVPIDPDAPGDLGTPGAANPECVVDDPCEPNPCDEPPPAACADERTRRTFAAPGACEAIDGEARCTYAPRDQACGQGEVCRGGECVPGAVPVGFCRTQAPERAAVETGQVVTFYGRVYQEGITDRSPGVDADERLLAELGYGPDGSDPDGHADWTWNVAGPNPGWDGAQAGEPNNDEYQVDVAAPAPGAYDFAFRFSADGGISWTYCDTGDAGSSDGYDPARAGDLQVRPVDDPCDPNPCVEPPPATCDGNTAVTRPAPGECAVEGGEAVCSYPARRADCGDDICVDGACVDDPCQPNPCDEPPAAECADDRTRRTYAAAGTCAVADGLPQCSYEPQLAPCADGERCEAGRCVRFVPGPQPGELLVTEIMKNPAAVDDTAGEWFEVLNRAGHRIELAGVRLADLGGNAFTVDGTLQVDPGAYVVFGRSADPLLNGGVTVDYAYGNAMTLSNRADEIVITNADGVEVARVAYEDGAGWADPRGASLQLDPEAEDPGAGGSWCRARRPIDASRPGSDLGTPGAANHPCRVPVGFCRMQHPQRVRAEAGDVTTWYGRVYQAGITDRSPAVDPHPELLAQFGYGPDGSEPAGAGWSWFDAAPNPGWDGAAAGERDNDEYQVDVPAPGLGVYDFAYRFSADGGESWTYCDTGDAGSSDGYAAANAGHLEVAVQRDPCEPNPCVEPPPDACDGAVAVARPRVGVCEAAGGEVSCTYPEERTDCAALGQRCEAGACVADPCTPNPCDAPPPADCADVDTRRTYAAAGTCEPDEDRAACSYAASLEPCPGGTTCRAGECVAEVPGPQPGDLVVTEIMYDPSAVSDADGEWFEVYNAADHPVELVGVVFTDRGTNRFAVGGDSWVVEPGRYVVFGRRADPARNGGARVDYAYGGDLALANGGDEIIITNAEGREVARVEYDDAGDWPAVRGAALQLDGALDPAVADAADGASWCEAKNPIVPGGDLGSPGAPNPPCTPPPVPVDACHLAPPLQVAVEAGTPVTFRGRVRVAGVTDRTPLVDIDPDVRGQLGIGPDGTRPDGDAGWTWADAIPDPAWDGAIAGEPAHDEYQAEVAPQRPGAFDFAFRFSADGGRSWTYCDGEAGSEDGYDPENAGQLEVEAPVVLPGPRPGELVITEVMYDPRAVDDREGEWFEVWNAGDRVLSLTGVAFADEGADAFAVDGVSLAIEPGQYLVLGRSADPETNGGVPVDYAYGGRMSLGNGDDELVITSADGEVIDRIAYGRGEWPDVSGASLQLDAALDHRGVDNDIGGHWCPSRTPIRAGGDLGTPGAPNHPCRPPVDPCDPNPCDAAPAPRCEGAVAIRFPALGECRAAGDEAECVYPEQRVDCGAEGRRCVDGACVDDPCQPNPCDAPPAAECADDATRRVYAEVGTCALVDGEPACDYAPVLEPCEAGTVCVDGGCVPVGDADPPRVEVDDPEDPASPVEESTPIVVTATVTDAGGLDEVILAWRSDGEWVRAPMEPAGDDRYEATIPSEAVLPPEVALFVEATDAAGNVGVAPADGEADPLVVEVLPGAGPAIGHEPPVEAARGAPLRVEAEIADPSGVAEATVYFRAGDGGEWAAAAMAPTDGDGWAADIPAEATGGDAVEYYLEAVDGTPAGFIASAPEGAPDEVFRVALVGMPADGGLPDGALPDGALPDATPPPDAAPGDAGTPTDAVPSTDGMVIVPSDAAPGADGTVAGDGGAPGGDGGDDAGCACRAGSTGTPPLALLLLAAALGLRRRRPR